ncbi:MmcQ/YjbR family DNA-binding protein [Paenibacillus sp. PL91]|uniref:MmcQ/YjbR family DNA-binding protein n=1 Tax=Paenibacillus sp. PL91 TaxID=2729538 RepID=UPI00145E0673|nr:MmcQ/YjbR family DNA-binding protein [Paenibacillus sp. PL91]MBC9198417.1 MmcQ/YjbR family DNA-binding protein [Paenibacillus sp. PL91]
MGHDLSGIKTTKGIKMLEEVRSICKELPEVVELIDGHGHNTFKVKDKSFIIMSDYGITFKSDLENQEILLQEERFFKPAYIGHRGWVSISDPQDWEEMGILIKEAYLRAAPKRIVKQFAATE